MGLYTQQISLSIEYDWNIAIGKLNEYINLVEQRSSGVTDIEVPIPNVPRTFYKFGEYATLAEAIGPNNYFHSHTLYGPVLFDVFPFLYQMKQDAVDLEPTEIAFNKIVGPMPMHVDPPSTGNAAIIYFFEDYDSKTVICEEGVDESYDAIANTAWLLNTQVKHQVYNHNLRYWFSFRFAKSFEECKKYFDKHSDLVYKS